MDTWEHMKCGEYTKAVDAYSERLKEQVARLDLFNRSLAFLNLGDYQRSLSDLEEAERIYREEPFNKKNSHRSDSYRNFMGVVHWIAGNQQDAVAVWKNLLADHEAGAITYTDAAGGVESPCLAWFGGTIQSELELVSRAERLLKKRLRAKQAAAWPGAIGQFVLGRITCDDLQKLATGAGSLASRHLCQASFWTGVKTASSGDLTKASELYRVAVESKALLDEEYYLAQYEYGKMRGSSLPT